MHREKLERNKRPIILSCYSTEQM
uniref:Uncharacterized protein n=1 Tax=Rhizophora mucronata TaxID=61149 RepID=A0A2P2NSM6_RHIMU